MLHLGVCGWSTGVYFEVSWTNLRSLSFYIALYKNEDTLVLSRASVLYISNAYLMNMVPFLRKPGIFLFNKYAFLHEQTKWLFCKSVALFPKIRSPISQRGIPIYASGMHSS